MLLDNIKNIKYTIKDENRDEYNVKDIYRIFLNDRQIWEKTEDIENKKIKQLVEYHYPLEIIWESETLLTNPKFIMEPLVNDTPALLADIYWDYNISTPSVKDYNGGMIEYEYPGTTTSKIHMVIDSKKWPFGCFIDTIKLYDHENFSNNNETYYKITEIRIGGGIKNITATNNLEPFYLTPGILLEPSEEETFEEQLVLGKIYHLAPIKPGLFDNISTLKTVRFTDSATIVPKNLITSETVDKIFIGAGVERIGANAVKVINSGAEKRTVKLKFETTKDFPINSNGNSSIVGNCEDIRLICFCHGSLINNSETGKIDNEKLSNLNRLFQGVEKYEVYDIDSGNITDIENFNPDDNDLFSITDVLAGLDYLLVAAKKYITENPNDRIEYRLSVDGTEVEANAVPIFKYTNNFESDTVKVGVNVYVNDNFIKSTVNSYITKKTNIAAKTLIDSEGHSIVAIQGNEELEINVIEVEK